MNDLLVSWTSFCQTFDDTWPRRGVYFVWTLTPRPVTRESLCTHIRAEFIGLVWTWTFDPTTPTTCYRVFNRIIGHFIWLPLVSKVRSQIFCLVCGLFFDGLNAPIKLEVVVREQRERVEECDDRHTNHGGRERLTNREGCMWYGPLTKTRDIAKTEVSFRRWEEDPRRSFVRVTGPSNVRD